MGIVSAPPPDLERRPTVAVLVRCDVHDRLENIEELVLVIDQRDGERFIVCRAQVPDLDARRRAYVGGSPALSVTALGTPPEPDWLRLPAADPDTRGCGCPIEYHMADCPIRRGDSYPASSYYDDPAGLDLHPERCGCPIRYHMGPCSPAAERVVAR